MTSNSLGETIQRDMGVVGQDERISRLYASMQGGLGQARCYASVDEINLAGALAYYDRKQRRTDPNFRMPAAT